MRWYKLAILFVAVWVGIVVSHVDRPVRSQQPCTNYWTNPQTGVTECLNIAAPPTPPAPSPQNEERSQADPQPDYPCGRLTQAAWLELRREWRETLSPCTRLAGTPSCARKLQLSQVQGLLGFSGERQSSHGTQERWVWRDCANPGNQVTAQFVNKELFRLGRVGTFE